MADPIFLDTNIFMYAAGKTHPYKNPCLHILKDVETKVLSAIINTEVFQELLYRYTHIGFAEKGIQLCNTILNYPLTILSVNEADIRLAIDLFELHRNKGVNPRDTIHAATLKTMVLLNSLALISILTISIFSPELIHRHIIHEIKPIDCPWQRS